MSEQPLQLNLKQILHDRIPAKRRRWIPGFLVSWLERLIHQEELNSILRDTFPKEGGEFATAVIEHQGLTLEVKGLENIPEHGRFIFVSNHPLGGLDGIALISVLTKKYGETGIRFLVNDMLMNVRPLRKVFLPINKYGSQARDAAKIINEVYESDTQVLIFPAGLVSRLHPDGSIQDLAWQKAFVVKGIQYQRDIIPIWFEGLNSPRFYKVAYWRKKLGLKVNIEQALLPGELCKARGKHFAIIFGQPISWQTVHSMPGTPTDKAAAIRTIVSDLRNH